MDKKLTLLFIDDEPNILTGLKRALHRMRDKWNFLFAESGEAALNIMEQESVDLIVTDMRMPEMNGLELLKIVADKYPQVIRFVLSGQSDEEVILKSVNYAHQYLAKPFKIDVLMKTVERVQNLRTPLRNKYLIRFVTGKKSLPSLPEVYTEICSEINSTSPNPKRIGEIIEEDASLSANVLKYVNSSFFGLSTNIKDAQHACIYLGIDTISSLVLSDKLFSIDAQASPRDIRHIRIFKEHSLTVSIIAQKMVHYFELGSDSAQDAISGGIMHDIGKLVLLSFDDSMERINQICLSEHLPLLDAELQVVGTTHPDIGAYLLGVWGLPATITDLVALHHQPSLSDDMNPTVLTCIHLANSYVNYIQKNNHHVSGPSYDLSYLSRIGLGNQMDQIETLLYNEYRKINHEA